MIAAELEPQADFSQLIKAQTYGLGFDLVGITSPGPAETMDAFDEWLSRGYAGEMEYLARGAAKRRDTRLPFPGVTSAIVVGLNYGGTAPSGPILERDLARRAGLGWFGSFFFIGTLVVDLDLEPDAPFEADRCGTCTRCLDACPTNAFVEPRMLDATRCISYLTIEAKGEIPIELREGVGDLIYGCDICQEVCPYNRKFSAEASETAFARKRPFTPPRAPRLTGRGRSARTAIPHRSGGAA